MFNFASKVINTIGDLISVEDPTKIPAPTSQPTQQPAQQRRFSGGDGRFFQQKPRFQGPSQDDHLPRIGPSTGHSIRPSSTPVYRYPTHSTTSYRPERYEESKFKAPDIDYNEDGYNVGRNYNGSERQSYITDIQKEYGMYREHDVDDANDYEEEDRYSLGYENEGNRRRRSLSSERDNSQLKNTEEYNENVIYPDTERNYYTSRDSHSSKSETQPVYDTHQTFPSGTYSTTENQSKNELAQFPSTSNAWISEEEEYHKTRRRRKSNSDEKGFRISDHEEKISLSPTSQEEDARNSSRSESESSDEISFGEALATGLVPPHITPEIAARMNIELINQPKAAIESFYGHSPGEVYTIPEEEDEICSPTGADGVTSLRKQRMASARVESSSNDRKELHNQRRIPSNNQQSELRQKQKYGGQSLDSKSEVERQIISDEMKENRPITSEFTPQDIHKSFNPTQKFQNEDHRQGVKQPFRYVQPSQSENAQYSYVPDKPTQQQPQPSTSQQKGYRTENRSQSYQPDNRPQMYQPDNRPEMYQPDGRPQVYQFNTQNYQADRAPLYTTDNRPQAPLTQDIRSQGYQGQVDNRGQTYPVENRPGGQPLNYQAESMQPGYQPDNRTQQPFQPQTYQPDVRPQGSQQDNRPHGAQQDNRPHGAQQDNRPHGVQQDNRPHGVQQDNRPLGYQQDIRPQGYQQDIRPQGYQQDIRPQGYQHDIRPQGFQPDIRPQGYQQDIRPQGFQPDNRPQGYQSDNRPQNYQPDPRLPGYQPDSRQGYQTDNRPQGYQPDRGQPHQPDNRPQSYQPDNRQPQNFQPQGHQPDTRPQNQPDVRPQNYQADTRSQTYPVENRPANSQNYPPDNRVQGYQQDNRSQYPPDTRPPQVYQADGRPQPHQPDNHPKVQETRRLPQPQQYDDQSQRQLPNQNLPPDQRNVYREQDNRYPQFQHPSDTSHDRRPSQSLPPQDYQYRQSERRQQPDMREDSQDPVDQPQSNRRRLPLRKYNSEERYGSFQQDYERRDSQSHESPGRMQHEEEYDSQGRPVRSRYSERLKHRSSSLDHDRNDPYYSRSRSSSFERSQRDEYVEDNTDYEQYLNREQRRASLEHKKILPRIAQDQDRARQNAPSGKSTQSRNQKVGVSEKTRTSKQGSWQENISQEQTRSHVSTDPRKGENFCLQHKKFNTPSTSAAAKPGRRVLPKEPLGQAQRKNVKRTQTQDKSTTTTKSEDSSHQRTGILSNAARKTGRSGHLKITFSDPISNLLNPNKKNASASNTVSGHSRTGPAKTVATKSDKPVITSNILPQSKNYIYPLPAVRNPNPSDLSHSPVPSSSSPLYRNQPQLDTSFRDSRLSMAANTRSLPIPIAHRTCSLDRYSSSETNLNASPYYHDQFSRPGSAPGLMYEPVHQQSNQPNPLSLYEMHALKKEEKFWSDIYSALPADMKHLITNRGIGSTTRKMSGSNASFSSVISSPATVIGGSHPAERASMENRMMQRSMISKGANKPAGTGRENFNSSLGERIGNRLRMLHEMKEQAGGFGNRRKFPDSLSRRSASDGEYSFSSTTNFPLCWNLSRRPHSDSAIDLIDRLEVQNSPTRMSGSAYNSSEYLTKVVDKSQSYLTSPCTNVPPSPAPTQPVRMLRDTALRGDHTESLQVNNYLPLNDNRSGFFSCLQNIESLTRQYEEEDRIRTELESGYDDEIYSEPGIPDTEYGRYHDLNRRSNFGHPARRRNDHF